MSGDVKEARKLLVKKAHLRDTEIVATERHLDRVREGRPESIESTSLQLDVLRDLRRIHSHISSVAYLCSTRLANWMNVRLLNVRLLNSRAVMASEIAAVGEGRITGNQSAGRASCRDS